MLSLKFLSFFCVLEKNWNIEEKTQRKKQLSMVKIDSLKIKKIFTLNYFLKVILNYLKRLEIIFWNFFNGQRNILYTFFSNYITS